MCDSPVGEMAVRLSAIEIGDLSAVLHPRDVKRHGYTLTRVLCTLRYLSRSKVRSCSRPCTSCTNSSGHPNRRVLEVARRHTAKEVQELCDSLAAVNKELEKQRLAHSKQQRTSTQVVEEQQSSDLSDEVVSLRGQLSLVTATAEGADRELARIDATTRALGPSLTGSD